MTGCDLFSPASYHETATTNSAAFMTDTNNNDGGDIAAIDKDADTVMDGSEKDKYSLRPRSMRRKAQQVKNVVAAIKSKASKPKEKPPPLSKYRRKTANARERSRMREINLAFETLRKAVPHVCSTQAPGANEKLTKITTLRLAMKYIATLSAALTSDSSECGSTSCVSSADLLSDCSDLDCLLSDGESLQLSDHSLLTSPDFPDSSLSPVVDFEDPSLPSLMHTDFSDSVLESPFGDYFLT